MKIYSQIIINLYKLIKSEEIEFIVRKSAKKEFLQKR